MPELLEGVEDDEDEDLPVADPDAVTAPAARAAPPVVPGPPAHVTDRAARLAKRNLRDIVVASVPPPHHVTTPSWLQRCDVFGGVPLDLDVTGKHVVFATTAPSNGRKAKDIMPPLHYNQAIHSPERVQWKLAVDAELEQLHSRHAFTAVPKQDVGDHLLLSTTWVFTVKDTKDPITNEPLLKFKARLTARGDLVDPK